MFLKTHKTFNMNKLKFVVFKHMCPQYYDNPYHRLVLFVNIFFKFLQKLLIITRSQDHKTIFMLNSTKHEISTAQKN